MHVPAFHGEYRPGLTTTTYLAVVGERTVWPEKWSKTRKDVTDDLPWTIMVVENHVQHVHCMEPRDLSRGKKGFSSPQYHDPTDGAV